MLRYYDEVAKDIREDLFGFQNAYAEAKKLKSNKLAGMVLAQIVFNFPNHSGLDALSCVSITAETCAAMSSPAVESVLS